MISFSFFNPQQNYIFIIFLFLFLKIQNRNAIAIMVCISIKIIIYIFYFVMLKKLYIKKMRHNVIKFNILIIL